MSETFKRILRPGERVRVLVVSGSATTRRLVRQVLADDPIIEIAGAASNPSIAGHALAQLNPDVLALDAEIADPATSSELRHSLEENHVQLDVLEFRRPEDLASCIHRHFTSPEPPPGAAKTLPAGVLAIGSSTGGPQALATLLGALPSGFPLPVLIVQHMPPGFTRLLAAQLAQCCPLVVKEAEEGEAVEPGKVLIAPGGLHMRVSRDAAVIRVHLDQSAPLNSCRPAVDALFASLAEVYGGAALAVILTGMGHDGLRGARLLSARAAKIVVQDEASSVVWGMPGSVASAGLADSVLPLNEIAPQILVFAAGSLRR